MNRQALKWPALTLCFLIYATPAWAAAGRLEYQEPQPAPLPGTGALLLRLVLSLVVVLGLAVVVMKLLQKRSLITQTGRWMRVLDQVGIGPNKALLLAEIAGRIYVLGVTDHGINKLLEIKDASQVAAMLEESQEAPWETGVLPRLWKKSFRHLLETKRFEVEDKGTLTRHGEE